MEPRAPDPILPTAGKEEEEKQGAGRVREKWGGGQKELVGNRRVRRNAERRECSKK